MIPSPTCVGRGWKKHEPMIRPLAGLTATTVAPGASAS